MRVLSPVHTGWSAPVIGRGLPCENFHVWRKNAPGMAPAAAGRFHIGNARCGCEVSQGGTENPRSVRWYPLRGGGMTGRNHLNMVTRSLTPNVIGHLEIVGAGSARCHRGLPDQVSTSGVFLPRGRFSHPGREMRRAWLPRQRGSFTRGHTRQ